MGGHAGGDGVGPGGRESHQSASCNDYPVNTTGLQLVMPIAPSWQEVVV
jgi:hypothetical protein